MATDTARQSRRRIGLILLAAAHFAATIVFIVLWVQRGGDLDIVNKQLAAANADLSSTRGQLDSTTRQLSTTSADLSSIKTQLDTTSKQLTAAQADLTSTRGQLDTALRQVAAAAADLASTKGQFDTTTQRLTAANADLVSTRGQLDAANRQFTTAAADLAAAKTQLDTTSKQLATANSSLAAANSQVADLTDIAQLRKSQVIAQNQTFTLAPSDIREFQVTAQYAGYVRVDFSSTGPVSVTSSQGYQSTAFTSGSLRVPIIPATNPTFVRIEAGPGLNKTVTATITYVY